MMSWSLECGQGVDKNVKDTTMPRVGTEESMAKRWYEGRLSVGRSMWIGAVLRTVGEFSGLVGLPIIPRFYQRSCATADAVVNESRVTSARTASCDTSPSRLLLDEEED